MYYMFTEGRDDDDNSFPWRRVESCTLQEAEEEEGEEPERWDAHPRSSPIPLIIIIIIIMVLNVIV